MEKATEKQENILKKSLNMLVLVLSQISEQCYLICNIKTH